jgi:V/A-type H+-transporting ATPase subunit G/H
MKWILWLGIFPLAVTTIGLYNPVYAVDEQRQAYDQMVEEATREADAYLEQKQKEQQEAAKEAQEQTEAAGDERIEAERQRLEDEIDKVRERGLDPNYTEGMRENQLQELEEKINLLNSDPEAYFNE